MVILFLIFFFFFNDTATTEIYTLSHTTLFRSVRRPSCRWARPSAPIAAFKHGIRFRLFWKDRKSTRLNSSHSQISYAVFCLKKKKDNSGDHLHPALQGAGWLLANNATDTLSQL